MRRLYPVNFGLVSSGLPLFGISRDLSQQIRRRFFLWILLDEAALDGELEDGLAELRDGVRGVVEEVEMVAHAMPGGIEGLRLAGGQQLMQHGLLKLATGVLPSLLPLLQLIAQRHQLGHLGHNTPLLVQRRDCDNELFKSRHAQPFA